jgi:tRNA(Ile)-lysidine synthase
MNPEPAAEPLTPEEFAAALEPLGPFEGHPFLAVAVSGGADSLALVMLADRWARGRGGEAWAVSVDHGLRPDSAAELDRLGEWLSARAIRHEILRWQGDKPATRIQERAREARYRLLAGWCREHGCLHLLTGHHRDDQAETCLLRRHAGSGPDGLAGMPAIREVADCRILRPLLAFPKARLVALLAAERQEFLTDPSNRNPAFERSGWRDAAGNPAIAADERDRVLAAAASHARRRVAGERSAEALLAAAVAIDPGGFAALDPEPILAALPEMAERALAALAAMIGGARYPLRRARVARLRAKLAERPRRGHTLGGCHFVPWRGRFLVLREIARAAPPAPVVPGACFLWDRRFAVLADEAAGGRQSIGYLGRAGAAELGRQARLSPGGLPRLVYPTLPAIWDNAAVAAVPRLDHRREAATAPPRLTFRSINPLTRAGFTVV